MKFLELVLGKPFHVFMHLKAMEAAALPMLANIAVPLQQYYTAKPAIKTLVKRLCSQPILAINLFSYDLEVTASPFVIEHKTYTMLIIKDISNEKRRLQLEKIFYHDILNISGSLDGFLSLANDSNDINQQLRLLRLARMASVELQEEILSQRTVLYAEKGELQSEFEPIDIKSLLINVSEIMKLHFLAKNKNISIIDSPSITFNSDKSLITRIIINMIKNAIEVTVTASPVTCGWQFNENEIQIWVHNHQYIPFEIHPLIFYRNFSTKGKGRGIGTYSMKLLAENYLNGKVSFTSSEKSGTKFTLSIPII